MIRVETSQTCPKCGASIPAGAVHECAGDTGGQKKVRRPVLDDRLEDDPPKSAPASPEVVASSPAGNFDRVAYQREYMKAWRAKRRAEREGQK